MTKIRKAKPEEWSVIVDFQQLMAMETENIQLDAKILSAGVKALFEHPERGCYFVAENDKDIVGSLLITYEWSDWRNKTIFWIQSVYVKQTSRRKGVYRQLYEHIRQMAENDPTIGGIRLYVDKTNIPAQSTYTNLGMNGEHYQLFEWMK
ncbi:MAG: GNAT family N-acetyltransferase [Bacteroidetes bacterium HGW-Bacteroidetes-1]|jgi:GNAT superfamily N-acetyltransferase|nr:MAG: GNAT family N-acetyltransferase [Bacteroidetes bacterium HGW-Bacteroidetes-1]